MTLSCIRPLWKCLFNFILQNCKNTVGACLPDADGEPKGFAGHGAYRRHQEDADDGGDHSQLDQIAVLQPQGGAGQQTGGRSRQVEAFTAFIFHTSSPVRTTRSYRLYSTNRSWSAPGFFGCRQGLRRAVLCRVRRSLSGRRGQKLACHLSPTGRGLNAVDPALFV